MTDHIRTSSTPDGDDPDGEPPDGDGPEGDSPLARPAAGEPEPSAPVTAGERITTLDTLRGFAVLGILVMNSIGFFLPLGSYFRIDGPGTETAPDWVIAIGAEVFVDQRFMALFSLLFGAGVVLFADRVEARGDNPVGLSLWRNTVLLGIGLLHGLLWFGDVLLIYALCSPVVLALRNASAQVLLRAGTGLVLFPVVAAGLANLTIGPAGEGLGDELWLAGGEMSGPVLAFFLVDYLGRALGMMLIGVALYRNGFLTGTAPAELYRNAAAIGLGVGLVLSSIGVLVVVVADFSPAVALPGLAPTTFGTIPAAIGYAALLIAWDRGSVADGAGVIRRQLHRRLGAVGRMALTNYLVHSVLGLLLVPALLDTAGFTRTSLAIFVVVVWLLQLGYSAPWLDRFRYGPAEWLWRCATYRRLLPIAR
ncbi:MAG: DUF418 domain-containing protein [Planctomycetota bacterium]